MAYNPVSGFTLQVITQTGEVASDYYLKFYEANTTTPLSMATDSTGGTLLVKAKLSDSGFPISNPLDNSTVFIPHMNANYRLVVYLDEADADANDTASAYVNIPSVPTLIGSSALGTATGEISLNEDLPTVLAPYLGRNLLINGDFSLNQRAVSGTVVLSAGNYGHDRFKAGSGGCTYTFATSAGVTTITISVGTLQQVVEATNIPASDVILSWAGTAQGRIDSGTYGDSGLVTDTTTGGTNFTVEFDTGTVSNVQLEFGDTATEFEYVTPADQLARCQRYYWRIQNDGVNTPLGASTMYTTGAAYTPFRFPVTMRSAPAISASSASDFTIFSGGVGIVPTALAAEVPTKYSFDLRYDKVGGYVLGYSGIARISVLNGFIAADAEL
tara:strand:- start:17672 stop:18829 length:1158 start_codon:yes stop_codon:yes gene_type:complete